MNNKITLSYVITTRNKLPYLKEIMKRLLENILPDEEIIITDGASTDGTVAFLTDLYNHGKIHQFISEPDYGEAHGFNKGILMAKGELIKFLSDDDIYDFQVIAKCKNYMISNPSIDLIFANICFINHSNSSNELMVMKNYEHWFKEWVDNKVESCFVCGLSLLFRRKSLSFLGLFDTSFKHIDLEYSVRVTSKKAKAAYCTHIMACSVFNEMSISKNFEHVQKEELKRISAYYNFTYLSGEKPANKFAGKTSFVSFLKKIRSLLTHQKEFYPNYNYQLDTNVFYDNLTGFFLEIPKIITEHNNTNEIEFISNSIKDK